MTKNLQKLEIESGAAYEPGALYVILVDGGAVLGCYREQFEGLPWFTPLAEFGDVLGDPCYLAGVCAGRRSRVYSWPERSASGSVSSGLPVREAVSSLARVLDIWADGSMID